MGIKLSAKSGNISFHLVYTGARAFHVLCCKIYRV